MYETYKENVDLRENTRKLISIMASKKCIACLIISDQEVIFEVIFENFYFRVEKTRAIDENDVIEEKMSVIDENEA